MGLMKENPRYHVLSFRVSDVELAAINAAIGSGTRQNYLLTAALDKLIGDRQAAIDAYVRAYR